MLKASGGVKGEGAYIVKAIVVYCRAKGIELGYPVKMPRLCLLLLLALASFASADEALWLRLGSASPAERVAARRALMRTPLAQWQERAFRESRPAAAIECILALCEVVPQARAREITPHICELITTLTIEQMSAAQQLALVRANRRVITRLGPLSQDENQQLLDLWKHVPLAESKPLQTETAALVALLQKENARK